MKKKGETISTRLKFTQEEMRTAVLRIVEDGVSLNTVAQEGGLCKKTLKSYLDKYLSTAAEKKNEFIFRPNYEINQVFTHELERIFEEYLLNVDRTVQQINRAYVRKAAFEFAMTCNVHVPKTWNVRKQAGLDWMYGFLGRHPIIKRTVITNKKIKSGRNEIFFVEVPCENYDEETVEEVVSLEDVHSANVDFVSASTESTSASGSTVRPAVRPSAAAVVNSKPPLSPRSDCFGDSTNIACGSGTSKAESQWSRPCSSDMEGEDSFPQKFKNIVEHKAISVKTAIDEFEENLRDAYCSIADDGYVPSDRVFNLDEIALIFENSPSGKKIIMTACCCVAANGHALPPFMIFPRRKFNSKLLRGYSAGVCGVASRKGVIDDRLFLQVLQHFRDQTHTSRHRKAVLIVDDDDYHVTINSIDFCQNSGIELVTLPPQSAGKLQPIERYAYRTLKAYFNSACARFHASNMKYKVSVYDVSALFNTIYPLAFTEENIIRGFNETSLYPLDEKVFAEVKALPTKLVNDELPSELLNQKIELVPSGICSEDESDESEKDFLSALELVEAIQGEDKVQSSVLTEYERKLAENFEEMPIEEYFNCLAFGFEELESHGGISPDRIFNMDEIELVVRMSENETPGLRLVSCCCVNAAGKSLPPMFVYPNAEEPLDSGIEGARSYTINQFENENDVFVAMLQHFVEHVTPTSQSRVLLIVDDEHSHVSIKSMDFCFEHGILLVTVPSQAAAPLQPLEKTVFSRLTLNFSAECDRFLEEKEGRRISMADMLVMFENVYEKAFDRDVIAYSFDEVGIWPLNVDKINVACFS